MTFSSPVLAKDVRVYAVAGDCGTVLAVADAAIHFDEIAAAMENRDNQEVANLFCQLAGFSQLRLAEVKSRAGEIDLEKHIPPEYVWPDHATPERTSPLAGDPAMSRVDEPRAARRGCKGYVAVAAVAKEFVKEEGEHGEHVRILEAWITREESAPKYAA